MSFEILFPFGLEAWHWRLRGPGRDRRSPEVSKRWMGVCLPGSPVYPVSNLFRSFLGGLYYMIISLGEEGYEGAVPAGQRRSSGPSSFKW